MQDNTLQSAVPNKTRFRRILRRCIIGLAWLVTVVVLIGVEETWRSKRAWEKYKGQLQSKGEKLSLRSLAPEPVPDEQNFAQTPFLMPLFDFRKDRDTNPGPSPWRDTNAFNRVTSFAGDLAFPRNYSQSWRQGKITDLPSWAAAMTRGTNYSDADAAAFTRAQAATQVLQYLKKYGPTLDELREASKRPYSRFNINYQDNIAALLPHAAVMKSISRLYTLRASAELALDRSEDALADVRMSLYLGDAIKNEPFLVSKLVRVAILQQTLQPVWEGVVEHKWSDSQLAELQHMFSGYDFISETADAFRGELALGNDFMEQFRTNKKTDFWQVASGAGPSSGIERVMQHLIPSAFFYQNQLKVAQMYHEVLLPMVMPTARRVYPELSTDQKVAEGVEKGFFLYRVFAKLLVPAVNRSVIRMAEAQTMADQTVLACALERYRLANNHLPASLDELKPKFVLVIPHDVINGEPLKYRRINDRQFVLYSVDWNQKDENGAIVMAKNDLNKIDNKLGDWVWPYLAE